jgi:hypothetical protein
MKKNIGLDGRKDSFDCFEAINYDLKHPQTVIEVA